MIQDVTFLGKRDYLFKGNKLEYRRKKQNSISSLLPQVCSNTNPTA